MKISQAIRMSMSAPLYWVPKYLTLDNIKHTIVDGGIAANYYIDIFDDNPRQTIGVSLYTKTKKKSQVGIINYFKDILDTMMTCNENEHIEDAHWSNTVKIDTGDITPFNLDIKSEQIEWTIIHGYQETLKALESKLKKEK
jgi:predicted acylesterase/phospholipase RssA